MSSSRRSRRSRGSRCRPGLQGLPPAPPAPPAPGRRKPTPRERRERKRRERRRLPRRRRRLHPRGHGALAKELGPGPGAVAGLQGEHPRDRTAFTAFTAFLQCPGPVPLFCFARLGLAWGSCSQFRSMPPRAKASAPASEKKKEQKSPEIFSGPQDQRSEARGVEWPGRPGRSA